MRLFKNEEEAYNWCTAEGNLRIQEEINLEKIKFNLLIAEEFLESAKDSLVKKRWNAAYTDYYDALHLLVESFLIFDRIKSSNHLCLFVCLCVKHPELELSWDFFEKVRTKRNGISYYGAPVSEKDWKEIKVQIELYINLLKKEIEKKLGFFKL